MNVAWKRSSKAGVVSSDRSAPIVACVTFFSETVRAFAQMESPRERFTVQPKFA